MPARLDRALQVRIADRLRARLARDATTGLPDLGALSGDDQRELCEVGGGRLAAVLMRVHWTIDAAQHPRAMHEVQPRVMHAVARLVDEQVRRTDLVGSRHAEQLLILAPGLDPLSGQSLAQRLREGLADCRLELGDVRVQVRVSVGCACRSAASPVGWTTQTLADEAERQASDPPPVASVA